MQLAISQKSLSSTQLYFSDAFACEGSCTPGSVCCSKSLSCPIGVTSALTRKLLGYLNGAVVPYGRSQSPSQVVRFRYLVSKVYVLFSQRFASVARQQNCRVQNSK